MANAATRLVRVRQANSQSALLAHKSELVAELAGAMANQFNNIMMAFTSYAELELRRAAPPARRGLEQLLNNAARGTTLVQRLLALSRHHTPSPKPQDLNETVLNIRDLIEQLVGDQIKAMLQFAPDVKPVKIDRVELEQLVLSLALECRNATTGGGQLTITTELVKLRKAAIGPAKNLHPGLYMMLSLACTGGAKSSNSVSDDADKSDRSTLLTVRHIAKEAGGFLRISNNPGEGSKYSVYLPAAGIEAGATAQSFLPRNLPVSQTILVVEDDDAVRVPATEFLKMEGFKVLQARTGAEAILVVERNRSTIDLLITDIVMPEMSGHEVASRLLQAHPDLKVLYMSGDADQTAAARGPKGAPNHILQKPFRLNKLREKIDELLP